MVGIYKVTNLINSKVYIGQSIKIENRWKEHKKEAFNPKSKCYNKCFYQAIRKYGIDNFKFEVLEECKIEELDEKEKYWIEFYQAFPPELGKGYNLYPGGTGNYRKLNNNQVLEIISLIKAKVKYDVISRQFNIGKDLLTEINKGYSYIQPNITYPIRKSCTGIKKNITYKPNKGKKKPSYEELLKSLYDLKNKELVAQKYEVSGNLIRKWCHSYGINAQDKKSYIEKYEKEFLGKEPKKKRPYKQIIAQIDPKTKEKIKEFNSRKEVREYLRLNPGCDKPLINAMKNNIIYKGYIWKLLN